MVLRHFPALRSLNPSCFSLRHFFKEICHHFIKDLHTSKPDRSGIYIPKGWSSWNEKQRSLEVILRHPVCRSFWTKPSPIPTHTESMTLWSLVKTTMFTQWPKVKATALVHTSMYWQPYQLKPKRVELNTYAKLDMSVAHSRNGFIPLLHFPLPLPPLHIVLLPGLPLLLPNLHPNLLLLPVLPEVPLLWSSSSFPSLLPLLPCQPFFWYLMDFFWKKVKNRICLIQAFQMTKAFWIQPNLIDRKWFEGHTGLPAFHSCWGILNILRCSLRAWRARHLGRRSLAFMMGMSHAWIESVLSSRIL